MDERVQERKTPETRVKTMAEVAWGPCVRSHGKGAAAVDRLAPMTNAFLFLSLFRSRLSCPRSR